MIILAFVVGVVVFGLGFTLGCAFASTPDTK